MMMMIPQDPASSAHCPPIMDPHTPTIHPSWTRTPPPSTCHGPAHPHQQPTNATSCSLSHSVSYSLVSATSCSLPLSASYSLPSCACYLLPAPSPPQPADQRARAASWRNSVLKEQARELVQHMQADSQDPDTLTKMVEVWGGTRAGVWARYGEGPGLGFGL